MAAAMGSFSAAFPTSSQLFPASPPRGDRTPERYLELATLCVERVQRMPSRQVDCGLCQYLAIKLELAVQQARECLTILRALERRLRSLSLEILSKPGLEIFKQLLVSATGVERFVDGCGEDQWLWSALIMANALENVSMIGYGLDFLCAALQYSILRCYESGAAMLTLAEVAAMLASLGDGRRAEDDIIRLRARLDQNRLLEKAKVLVQSSEVPDPEKRELAAYLLGRLTAAMAEIHGSGGSSPLKSWKMDYRSLEPRESLGAGTAGIVHRTEWLGVVVAEKTFFDSDQPSFEEEVSSLAGLCHPNVVSLLGYAVGDGNCSLVMELMDEDLFHLMRTRLRRDRSLTSPFTISEAVDIMLQIAEGVRYLHEGRVVHRDLKSRNILVTRAVLRGVGGEDTSYIHAKVADFGLSRTKEASSAHLNTITWGTGTTRWRAPELMALEDPGVAPSQANTPNPKMYPFKCDVYSFAMVCYEILTGGVPFSVTSSPSEVKRKVLAGGRPALPGACPFLLKDLIERCWVSEASTRPSFGEICAELRGLKFMLMTGSDVDNCDPINSPLHQQHTMQARASPEATPLERGIGFPAGTRLPLDKATRRLLDMHLDLDMRPGNVGGGVEKCEPVVHEQVGEGQARAILRRALGTSFASRSLQPDDDPAKVCKLVDKNRKVEEDGKVDKGGGRLEDLGKKGSRTTVNEVVTKKPYGPHSCDGQKHMRFEWYDSIPEPRMYAEVAAGFRGPGCLKRVSCGLKHV